MGSCSVAHTDIKPGMERGKFARLKIYEIKSPAFFPPNWVKIQYFRPSCQFVQFFLFLKKFYGHPARNYRFPRSL